MLRRSPFALPMTIATLLLAGCDGSTTHVEGGHEIVKRDGQPDYVRSSDDALLHRARDKARSTYRDLVAALESPQPQYDAFAIKKGFATPDGGLEHIWISYVKWDGENFQGVIDNEPVETQEVALGDKVTVRPDELTDWLFLDGDQLRGGYTVRAIYAHKTEDERRDLAKQMGHYVPPVDF